MLQLNLENRAPIQSTEKFNSMCKFGEVFLGASTGGIARITGYTDNGAEINALMKSGTTDYGTDNLKRFRFFYITGESNGKCLFSVYAGKTLVASKVITPKASGFFKGKLSINHTIQSRYWSWKLENVDGSFLSVYKVKALPIILHGSRI